TLRRRARQRPGRGRPCPPAIRRAAIMVPGRAARYPAPPMPSPYQRDFTLEPADTERLANLSGPFDGHLRQIELALGVEIANRGNVFRVTGEDAARVDEAERLLRDLYREAASETFDGHAIHLRVNASRAAREDQEATRHVAAARAADADYVPQDVAIRVKRGTIRGRGANQQKYLHAIATHDINFGVGPAGTGKTY